MNYNSNYYHSNSLWQLRPAAKAINTYKTSDGIIIGMFQGKRGQYPDIDFVVKILKPGLNERPFPPIHSLWVVDLMLKINDYKNEVRDIVKYYLDFYNTLTPFQTPNSRHNYQLQTLGHIVANYSHINQSYTLSLEYVAIIIELFCLNEKRNAGAYMFRDLLQTVLDYTNGTADYIQVVQASQPGFR
ncbi:hypothetical protein PDL71_14435 [Lacibacter sp. MH-610]|uniref:hypothetical protein n=1 Tax=Lacibacter sp. MH-610 TaxID=3020883 RepID=UPI003892B851